MLKGALNFWEEDSTCDVREGDLVLESTGNVFDECFLGILGNGRSLLVAVVLLATGEKIFLYSVGDK